MTTGEKISIKLKAFYACHPNPFKDKHHKESTRLILAEKTKAYFLTHPHPRQGHVCSAEEVANIKAGCAGKVKEYYKTHLHHMEGKILPDSWRISIANGLEEHWKTHIHHQTGVPRPEAVRRKIGKASKGHPNYLLKQPASYFIKMREYWDNPEWVEAMAEKHRGDKSSLWKGGISNTPYPFGWRSSLRKSIRKRDGWRCQNPFCRDGSGKLHVHHIDYNKDNLLEYNLITLCQPCHAKTNHNRAFYTFLFQNAMINFYRCQEANKIERVA